MTTVKLFDHTQKMLDAIVAKRKRNGDVVRKKQDIVEELIAKAYSKECKNGKN